MSGKDKSGQFFLFDREHPAIALSRQSPALLDIIERDVADLGGQGIGVLAGEKPVQETGNLDERAGLGPDRRLVLSDPIAGRRRLCP